MSALTLDQAKTIAAAAYDKYFSPSYYQNTNNHSLLFQLMDGLNPDQALKLVLADVLYFEAIHNPSAFPGYTVTVGQTKAAAFVESLPTDLVLNFLYPQASADTRAAMATAINTGAISKENFTYGILKLGTTNTAPTLADVTKAATTAGLADSYPDSGLHMPGVTSSQQNLVDAMYLASFNRSPEYNGLNYWTHKLSVELGYGTDQKTALGVVSKQMYIDGKGNGESGTTLADAAYVSYAYQNILGRDGEAAGVQYWNNQLTTGAVDRGTFVANFVSDALGNAGDGDFLQARIAVANFVAQAHVSGPSAPPGIDLHGIIQNVHDAASANSTIAAIIQKYGTASQPRTVDATLNNLLSSWDTQSAPADHSADVSADNGAITLSGVVSVETFSLVA